MFTCRYFAKLNGKTPVENFIDSLDDKTQVKYFEMIELLKEHGPKLCMPYSKHLERGIFELRFKGKDENIRILYFFYYRKNIILTNGFKKKENKVPRKEIDLAKKRRKIVLDKYKKLN